MTNIVIPMAGEGSRFTQAGYPSPKPFIPVNGKCMIEHVIDNIAEPEDRVYLICRTSHLAYLQDTPLIHRPNVVFKFIDRLTEGTACTLLTIEPFLRTEEPLIIANSDQYVRYRRADWQQMLQETDAAIMTFPSTETKWSYAKVESGRVVEVAEKKVISEHATVGIYFFQRGRDFVRGAHAMIAQNKRVNNEFYTCPVFNELCNELTVRIFPVEAMYGMGTPEDLERNLRFIGE